MVSMNNRRGFFGTIFAAIFGSKVAKAGKVEHFVLKPRSVGMTTYSLQTLTEIWAQDQNGVLIHYFLLPSGARVDAPVSPYWHGQLPFVYVHLDPLPWKESSST